jgi:hypoxanthine phosphoribosyltransferase
VTSGSAASSRNAAGPAAYSAARIAARVAALGKEITRAYKGRRVDVVITLDRGFIFAADLIRQLGVPVACHFVSEAVRDVQQSGHSRREVSFGAPPDLKGRDVLLVDAVIESGVTQEFLLRRLAESRPRSLRLAVLLYKEPLRRVDLEPDYFGFRTASNKLWIGYGLAGDNGVGRNVPGMSSTGPPAKQQGLPKSGKSSGNRAKSGSRASNKAKRK